MSCQLCGGKLSLVAQELRCKCGGHFCDKHRAPEKHSCGHDWQSEQTAKLRQANPPVFRAAALIDSQDAWNREYCKFHHPRGRYAFCHSLGFLVFVYYVFVRGLLLNVAFGCVESASLFGAFSGQSDGHDASRSSYELVPTSGAQTGSTSTTHTSRNDESTRSIDEFGSGTTKTGSPVVILFQQLFFGVVLGYLCAHTLPHLLEKFVDKKKPERPIFGGGCRFCLFSWDALSYSSLMNTQYAFVAEWEMVKDHILYHIITRGRSNCLSHLYTGPDRSVSHISKTVKNKLEELNYGRGR